jgi:hypothetical protein
MADVTRLYRYEAEDCETTVKLKLEKFHILKETPCGYWVPRWAWYGEFEDVPRKARRWVAKTGRKRFAYSDKADALRSFKERKRRYVQHAERRFRIAELSVQLDTDNLIVAKPEAGRFQLL